MDGLMIGEVAKQGGVNLETIRALVGDIRDVYG